MNSHTTHLSPQATARAVGNDLRREAWSRMKPRGTRSSEVTAAEELQAFPPSPGHLNVDGIRRGCPREVEEGDEASERIVDQEHARRHRMPNRPLRSPPQRAAQRYRVRQKPLPSPLLTF